MTRFDRFSAEALIQALVGGALPEHLNIILFDREVGWRLVTMEVLADLIEQAGQDTPFAILWEDIIGKPSVFPPEDHTHVAADITDFSEAVDDRVATLMVAGTGITLTYDDGSNTLTVSLTTTFDTHADRILCDEDYVVMVDEDFNILLSEEG